MTFFPQHIRRSSLPVGKFVNVDGGPHGALKMKLTSNSVMEVSAYAWLWAHCSSRAHATKARANTGPYRHVAKASSSINAMCVCVKHPDNTSRTEIAKRVEEATVGFLDRQTDRPTDRQKETQTSMHPCIVTTVHAHMHGCMITMLTCRLYHLLAYLETSRCKMETT